MSQHKVRPRPESTAGPAAPAGAAAILATLGRVERGITIAAFGLLIGVVFADVVSREFLGRGLHWALQAGVYANYVVVLAGLGIASAGGAHLRPRFADAWLPARFEPWLARLPDLGMALFALGFAAVATGVVAETRALGDRSAVLGNLLWPLQALMPLAFLAAAVRHGLYARWPALRPPPASEGAEPRP
jgi:TRAP-type C4-dicarboxylate transport system permease small subunit